MKKNWLLLLITRWIASFYRDWYSKWQVKIKILISFYQVFVGVTPVFDIDFPPEFKQLLSYLGLLELNLFSITPLSCLFGYNYHFNLLFSTLWPAAACGTLMLLSAQARRRARRRHGPDAISDVAEGWSDLAFLLLFLIYPSVSSTIFRTFLCVTLDDGSRYLRLDFSIDCDSREHQLAASPRRKSAAARSSLFGRVTAQRLAG